MVKKRVKTKKAVKKQMPGVKAAGVEPECRGGNMSGVEASGGMSPTVPPSELAEGLREALQQLVGDYPSLKGNCVCFGKTGNFKVCRYEG